MITKVEKLRRTISWIIAGVFFFVVLFSKTPFEGSFIYETIEMIGYVLITLATLGRIWCTVYIGGRKDEELCQDGPYSIIRNPLYIFSFLGVMGIMCGTQNLMLLLIMIPLFLGYYYFIITSEEKRLLKLFGREFTDYCSKTNKIIPNFSNYWSKNIIKIDPKIMFRSITDASVFMWLFVALEILEYFKILKINGENIIPVLWRIPF